MSNHARGLWGYTGLTAMGRRLTIQATGMGGPSAAIVLADMVELGLSRAVRVGTCVAIDPMRGTGELLEVGEALAADGEAILPDPELGARLRDQLSGRARTATITSRDRLPPEPMAALAGFEAADLQTATVLSCARTMGFAAAVVLIVEETARGERITDGELEAAARGAGLVAAGVLST